MDKGAQSWVHKKSDTTEQITLSFKNLLTPLPHPHPHPRHICEQIMAQLKTKGIMLKVVYLILNSIWTGFS